MSLCAAALSQDGAGGVPGQLEVTGVSVASLAAAIDASRMLAATTPKSMHVRTVGGAGEEIEYMGEGVRCR